MVKNLNKHKHAPEPRVQYIKYSATIPNLTKALLGCKAAASCGEPVLTQECPYLRSKYVEVSGSIRSADELAPVLRGNAGIFGQPHHRGSESVRLETDVIEGLTLFLTETFPCQHKQGIGTSSDYTISNAPPLHGFSHHLFLISECTVSNTPSLHTPSHPRLFI